MAARNRITVDSLLQDLAEDRALARELGQASAAISATQLAAKLVGLLVDRKEAGAPGDFASLQTADAVLDAVRKDLGDAAADVVARLLSQATPAEALPGSARTATEALDTMRDPSEPLN